MFMYKIFNTRFPGSYATSCLTKKLIILLSDFITFAVSWETVAYTLLQELFHAKQVVQIATIVL
jgi:hypothetical protein